MALLNEAPLMAAADEKGVRYNTDDVQATVQGFSGVLHRLLLQHALWASFAGIEDITRPNMIRELTQETVRAQWNAFCEESGFDTNLN
ncbi:MAG: hypothetical protein LBU77_03290 [Clostridiales bacterium]|nr:hypothetical protein [Clostridiales bacterium]